MENKTRPSKNQEPFWKEAKALFSGWRRGQTSYCVPRWSDSLRPRNPASSETLQAGRTSVTFDVTGPSNTVDDSSARCQRAPAKFRLEETVSSLWRRSAFRVVDPRPVESGLARPAIPNYTARYANNCSLTWSYYSCTEIVDGCRRFLGHFPSFVRRRTRFCTIEECFLRAASRSRSWLLHDRRTVSLVLVIYCVGN